MIAETKTNSHILTETVCTIPQVAKLLPSRPNVATVWRWSKRGLKGEVLETYCVGGKILTSHEAVHRFLEATQKR